MDDEQQTQTVDTDNQAPETTTDTSDPSKGPQKTDGGTGEPTKDAEKSANSPDAQIEAFEKYAKSRFSAFDRKKGVLKPLFDTLDKTKAAPKELKYDKVLKTLGKPVGDETRETYSAAIAALCRVWGTDKPYEPPKPAEEQIAAFEANVKARYKDFDRKGTILKPLFDYLEKNADNAKPLDKKKGLDAWLRKGSDKEETKELYLGAFGELRRVWGTDDAYQAPTLAADNLACFKDNLKALNPIFDRKRSVLRLLLDTLESPKGFKGDDISKLLLKKGNDVKDMYVAALAEIARVSAKDGEAYQIQTGVDGQIKAFEENAKARYKDFDRQKSILKPLFDRLDKNKASPKPLAEDKALALVGKGTKDEPKEIYLGAIKELCRVWGTDEIFQAQGLAGDQIMAFEATAKLRYPAFDRQKSVLKPIFMLLDKNKDEPTALKLKKTEILKFFGRASDKNEKQEVYIAALEELCRVWGTNEVYKQPSSAEEHIVAFDLNVRALNPGFDRDLSVLGKLFDHVHESKHSPEKFDKDDVLLLMRNGKDKKEMYHAAMDELVRVWGTDEPYIPRSAADGQLTAFTDHVKTLNKDFDRKKSILKPLFDLLEKQNASAAQKGLRDAEVARLVKGTKDEPSEQYVAAITEITRIWGTDDHYVRPTGAQEQIAAFTANVTALNKQFDRKKSVLARLYDYLDKEASVGVKAAEAGKEPKLPKKLTKEWVEKLLAKGNDKKEMYGAAIDELCRVWGTEEPYKQAEKAAAGVPPIVFARRNGAKLSEFMAYAAADMMEGAKLVNGQPDWKSGRAMFTNPPQQKQVLERYQQYQDAIKDAKPGESGVKAAQTAADMLKPDSDWNAGEFKKQYEAIKKNKAGTFAQFAFAVAHLLTTKQEDALRVEIVAFKPKGAPGYVHAYVLLGREGDDAKPKVPNFRSQEEIVLIDGWAAAMGHNIACKGAGNYPLGLVDGLDMIACWQPASDKK